MKIRLLMLYVTLVLASCSNFDTQVAGTSGERLPPVTGTPDVNTPGAQIPWSTPPKTTPPGSEKPETSGGSDALAVFQKKKKQTLQPISTNQSVGPGTNASGPP